MMLDVRNGRTIIGWVMEDLAVAGDEWGPLIACDAEADNWVIDWVGTDPPGSAWATMDDRRDDSPFRVEPLHLNADQIPEGTACRECGTVWDGHNWVSEES